MALNNQQVVDSLISYYKSNGEDMTYLLEDPMFNRMPIQDKVEAIKLHAKTFRDSSPATLNRAEKADLKASLLGSAITGIGAGMLGVGAGIKLVSSVGVPLAQHMKAHRIAAAVSIGSVLLASGAVSGILGYAKAKQLANARQAVRRQLLATQENPSDDNAIGVLASKAQYSRDTAFSQALMGSVKNLDPTSTLNKKWVSDQYVDTYKNFSSLEN
jgi:hypothetical protein